MAYCPHCGSEVEHEPTPEQREERALVEIERIKAERDVTIARLQSRAMREELETTEHVAEVQADAEVESAVAEAEVIAAGLDAGVEPAPEPQPITIVDDDQEDQEELPPREEHHEPRSKKSTSYFGF